MARLGFCHLRIHTTKGQSLSSLTRIYLLSDRAVLPMLGLLTIQTKLMPRLLQWYDVGASACCLGITTADTHIGMVFTSINTPEVAVPPKKLGVIIGNRQAPPVVNPPTKMGILLGNKQIPKVIVPMKKNGLRFW